MVVGDSLRAPFLELVSFDQLAIVDDTGDRNKTMSDELRKLVGIVEVFTLNNFTKPSISEFREVLLRLKLRCLALTSSDVSLCANVTNLLPMNSCLDGVVVVESGLDCVLEKENIAADD